MFENFNQPIDLYCERISADFWAEPLNALTNLAFIIAAVFAYALWRRQTSRARDILTLIIIMTIVGVGSFIFHTVATHGAMLADVIPIAIFIFYAIYVIFTRVFHLKWFYSIVSVVGFLIFNALLLSIFGRALLNGSIQYIPTFIFLLAVALYSWKKRYSVTSEFFLSSFIFLLALTCRSIDQKICPQFPIGTHFLWHVLNAVVMYYVVKGVIMSVKSKQP